MIEAIVSALLSSAAAGAGKEIYQATARRLRTLFGEKPDSKIVADAIDHLESGEYDPVALRDALKLLKEEDLSRIKGEIEVLRNETVFINFDHSNVQNNAITGIANNWHGSRRR
jgi:hypothetical protein